MATATTLSLIAPGMALLLAGPAAAADVSVERVPGQTRYDTAAAAAADAFGTASTVVLVNGEAFPDAMSAAYLAGLHDAPILLTQPGSTPSATSKALASLGAKKVIVVGGESAVSPAQAQALSASGLAVSRVTGADRFATAAAAAREGGQSAVHVDADGKRTAFVASGEVFADAMAAGPVAYAKHVPVLLTRGTTLSTETATALRALEVHRVVVLGGTGAVSAAVAAQLDRLEGVEVDRVQGANRRATAVAIAEMAREDFDFGTTTVGLANGTTFPDALAAAPLLGKAGAPLLLTGSNDDLGSETRSYLAGKGGTVATAKVFGGIDSVAGSVLTTIRDVITSAPAPTTPPVTPVAPPATTPQPDPDSTAPAPADLTRTDGVVHVGKDGVLQFTGHAEADATVTLHRAAEGDDADVLIGSVTAVGGTFTIPATFADDLAEQSYVFHVTVTDAAGNTSVKSASQTVVFDITAPGEATDVDQDVRGATGADTLTVTGTAEAGARVLLLHGPEVIGTTVAHEETGAFTVELDLRLHAFTQPTTLTVVVHDLAFNRSAPVELAAITVDHDAPDAPVVVEQTPAGLTTARTLVVSGTAEPGSTVHLRNYGTRLVSDRVDADGDWSVTFPLAPDGISQFDVVAVDEAGNESTAVPLAAVTQDSTPPSQPVLPHAVLKGQKGVTLTGTAAGSTRVEVVHGPDEVGTADVAQSGGSFSVALDLSELGDGQHPLRVFAVDAAGLRSEVGTLVTVDLDATEPVLTGLSTDPTGPTKERTFTLAGTAEQGATVTVTVAGTTASQLVSDPQGSFAFPVTLAGDVQDGELTVKVTATDQHENVSAEQTLTVELDTAAPDAATVTQPGQDGPVDGASLTVVGTATEEGATVEIRNGQVHLGTDTVVDGEFSIDVPLLGLLFEQHTTLSVVVKDDAGNTSGATNRVVVRRLPAGAYGEYTVQSHEIVDGTGTVMAYPSSGGPDDAVTFGVHAGDAFDEDGSFVSADEFAERLTAGDTLSIDYRNSSGGTSVFHLTDLDEGVVELLAAGYEEGFDDGAGNVTSDAILFLMDAGSVVSGRTTVAVDADGDVATGSDQRTFTLSAKDSPSTPEGDYLEYEEMNATPYVVRVTSPDSSTLPVSFTPGMTTMLRQVLDGNDRIDWATAWTTVDPMQG